MEKLQHMFILLFLIISSMRILEPVEAMGMVMEPATDSAEPQIKEMENSLKTAVPMETALTVKKQIRVAMRIIR